MTIQYSATHRTNRMATVSTDVGINAVLKVFSGPPPANCSVTDSGVLGPTFAGNATAFGSAANGVFTAGAIAAANSAAAIIAGYYRIYPNLVTATNAVVQGTVFQSTPIATSAATAVNSNVLTFTATTGVTVGMTATGTGYPAGATVVAVTPTAVTLSAVSTLGVATATTITFGGDMTMVNTNMTAGQSIAFNSMTFTASGA